MLHHNTIHHRAIRLCLELTPEDDCPSETEYLIDDHKNLNIDRLREMVNEIFFDPPTLDAWGKTINANLEKALETCLPTRSVKESSWLPPWLRGTKTFISLTKIKRNQNSMSYGILKNYNKGHQY